MRKDSLSSVSVYMDPSSACLVRLFENGVDENGKEGWTNQSGVVDEAREDF
jgi:hypothetical protein